MSLVFEFVQHDDEPILMDMDEDGVVRPDYGLVIKVATTPPIFRNGTLIDPVTGTYRFERNFTQIGTFTGELMATDSDGYELTSKLLQITVRKRVPV